MNSFTCRASRQGWRNYPPRSLADELLHLPGRPAGAAAIARWETVVGPVPGITTMQHESVQVTNLSTGYLGLTTPQGILIDADAAGYGWYVDPTPGQNEAFSPVSANTLTAVPGGHAAGKMDLLTVVMHELGHLLGYQDGSQPGIMQLTLTAGTRILPSAPGEVPDGAGSLNPVQAGTTLVPQASLVEAAQLLQGRSNGSSAFADPATPGRYPPNPARQSDASVLGGGQLAALFGAPGGH